MGAGILWLVLIIAVIATVFVIYFSDSQDRVEGVVQDTVNEGIGFFQKFSFETTKGDKIEIENAVVEGDNEQVEAPLSENFTQVVEVADKERIQVCYILDPNGCKLQGTAKLINPVTLEPIKPYTYTYVFNIECAEIVNGFDYCHTDDVQRDGYTFDAGKDEDGNEIGGRFEEVWRPYGDDFATTFDSGGNLVQKGLYDVEVFVRSKKLAETDRYEEIWIRYQIELRK